MKNYISKLHNVWFIQMLLVMMTWLSICNQTAYHMERNKVDQVICRGFDFYQHQGLGQGYWHLNFDFNLLAWIVDVNLDLKDRIYSEEQIKWPQWLVT